MNPRLKKYFDRTVELLRNDPRVIGAYMTGSVGTPKEDAFSDADLLFLTRPSSFESLDRDLPGIFAQAGITPVLRWPELGSTFGVETRSRSSPPARSFSRATCRSRMRSSRA
jgi:hypothetical protein